MKRSGTKAKYSSMEEAKVYQVQFTTMPQDLLQKWSVAEITDSKLYEGSNPSSGSPNDLRMGVSSQDQKCETCGETKQCQGHFGHIKLQEPVLHYGFLKYVEKILRCVCHRCCKLKQPATRTEAFKKKWRHLEKIQNPSKRLNEITKLLQHISECKAPEQKGVVVDKKSEQYCNMKIPTNVSLRNYRFFVSDVDDSKKMRPLERHEIKKILEEVSKNEDACLRLGFTMSKPIDLMIQSLAVPPPQIRPSIEMNPQKKAEDDITTAYVKIININNELKKGGTQNVDKQSKIDDLERTIASIMIKLNRAKLQKTALGKKKAVKAYKSISDRLKGKQGRFRQNLMGKRVDFSARSVISGDSNLALDELGVPQKIAARLTVPEQVTKWNYQRIVNLCKQGKVQILLKPPEDRLKDSQKPINVSKIDQSEIQKYINYGMIAQRCLQDGDYVLFNRQPTLHRMSMMGHRVKILPYNTFRLNLSVCTPYNADFDGDEMNMHVPQTFETISELKNIAHVPKQIIAPKNNAPVMGMVQDALLGVYLFTMRDTFLTREQIMNLVIWIQGKQNSESSDQLLPGELPIPAILKPEPMWTGKQVMSMIIPKKITIQIKKGNNPLSNVQDISMIIKKGQLITGALQKQVVGSGAGGLVHSIWLQIGPDATNQFISIAQRIVNNWLISSSFTVGASDIAPDEDFVNAITKDYRDINKLYYETFNNYRDTKIIDAKNLHQRGKRIMDSFEFNINQKLNSRLGTAQDGVKKFVSPYVNNIFKMITAKSKGSQTNLAQIMYLVGNQNVDGKRCPLGFSRRALPHFQKDDNSPQPRGFVFSSFYQGLKPHEFFFHSMGGREGLSDTAVKTSRTGYIQRKLVKSLQDLVIKYDGTVRDSKNNFLQKMYGEDGFISEYIQKHKFGGAELSETDFQKNYKWNDLQLINYKQYSNEQVLKLGEEYDKLLYARRRMRQIFVNGKDVTSIEYHCPINVARLVNKIKATNYHDRDIVDPYYAYTEVEKLINKCIPSQSKRKYQELQERVRKVIGTNKKAQEKRLNYIRDFQQESGIQIFRIHIMHNLASKKLCEIIRISKTAFNRLLQQVQYKFHQALAPAGESIGSIAAQSIGEPTTQMTLNTFHLAGVSDKNVTLGVPRLQELLDVSKNIKTPNMTVFLKNKILAKDFKENRERILDMIMHVLPERHVKDYIQSTRLYYDSNYMDSKSGFRYKENEVEAKRTPLVLNIQFNLKKITLKSLWSDIMDKLERSLQETFQIIEHVQFSDSKQSNPQLTFRLLERGLPVSNKKQDAKDYDNMFTFINRMQQQIKALSVGGISGIKSVKTSNKFFNTVPESSKINLNQKQKQQYSVVVFETDGSNLKQCLSRPQIDATKTYSNDMTEIYSVLGIEAARQSFINQFKQIIKPYGIYVNYRHLSVLVDWMSMRGTITPVNRNGINRVKDVSVLRKASYEETADILFGAAAFGERDYLKGISEKVIFGQAVEIGTNSFKIMIDTNEVSHYKAKAGTDKNQILGQNSSFQSGMMSYRGYGSQIMNPGMGDRTPMPMNTPNPYEHGGQSILSMRSPGPDRGWSASFTPVRDVSFTPIASYDAMMSPNFSRTPINNPFYGSQTPISHTPLYTIHNSMASPSVLGTSTYQRYGQTSGTPNYRNMGSSSSPSYSDVRMSQSPSYSPANSHNSSPNYSPRGGDSSHENNPKVNDDDEDHEEGDDF